MQTVKSLSIPRFVTCTSFSETTCKILGLISVLVEGVIIGSSCILFIVSIKEKKEKIIPK